MTKNMASNSTMNFTSVEDIQRSQSLLQSTMIPNAFFILFGLLAITFNIFLIVVVVISKKLHTKCFMLLVVNACSDLLLGIGYTSAGIIRAYRYLEGKGELMTMWRCCLEVSLITYAQLLSLSMAFVLIVDRLLASFYPHKYKLWNYKQFTIPLIVGANLFALILLGSHYYDSWTNDQIILLSCSIADSVLPSTLSIVIPIQIFISITIVILNAILALKISKQNKKLKAMPGTRAKDAKRQEKEVKIFRAITVIAATHIFTHLGGRLVILFMNFYEYETTTAAANRYAREAVLVNAALHFFVLLVMSSDFRDATKKLFCRIALPQITSSSPSRKIAPAVPMGTIAVSGGWMNR